MEYTFYDSKMTCKLHIKIERIYFRGAQEPFSIFITIFYYSSDYFLSHNSYNSHTRTFLFFEHGLL